MPNAISKLPACSHSVGFIVQISIKINLKASAVAVHSVLWPSQTTIFISASGIYAACDGTCLDVQVLLWVYTYDEMLRFSLRFLSVCDSSLIISIKSKSTKEMCAHLIIINGLDIVICICVRLI